MSPYDARACDTRGGTSHGESTHGQYVRCNMCEWQDFESELDITEDAGGFFRACPNCKTDAYLMDVPTPTQITSFLKHTVFGGG